MNDVLIVEDDEATAEVLKQTLRAHGYATRTVRTGADALDHLDSAKLVLLDLDLPDLDGLEVCRRIREQSCVPVIALSGRTDELNRVMALHLGADDFMSKPFGRYELVARIQAILRRTAPCTHLAAEPISAQHMVMREPDAPRRLRAGPLEVDLRTRTVRLHGDEVRITRKEFDLLAILLRNPGTVMERQEIISKVWDENWFGSTRTLDVHVGSLRSKLGNNEWIETARGVGYRLTVPTAMLG